MNQLLQNQLHDSAIPLPGIYPKVLKVGAQILVHHCSQQHYSQKLKGENKPGIYKSMSG